MPGADRAAAAPSQCDALVLPSPLARRDLCGCRTRVWRRSVIYLQRRDGGMPPRALRGRGWSTRLRRATCVAIHEPTRGECLLWPSWRRPRAPLRRASCARPIHAPSLPRAPPSHARHMPPTCPRRALHKLPFPTRATHAAHTCAALADSRRVHLGVMQPFPLCIPLGCVEENATRFPLDCWFRHWEGCRREIFKPLWTRAVWQVGARSTHHCITALTAIVAATCIAAPTCIPAPTPATVHLPAHGHAAPPSATFVTPMRSAQVCFRTRERQRDRATALTREHASGARLRSAAQPSASEPAAPHRRSLMSTLVPSLWRRSGHCSRAAARLARRLPRTGSVACLRSASGLRMRLWTRSSSTHRSRHGICTARSPCAARWRVGDSCCDSVRCRWPPSRTPPRARAVLTTGGASRMRSARRMGWRARAGAPRTRGAACSAPSGRRGSAVVAPW